MKNKKIIIPTILIILSVLVLYFIFRSKGTNTPNSFFLNTIPLLNKETNQNKINDEETIFPPINPAQTNYQKVTTQITDQVSEIEKDKIVDDLPYRVENFVTGTKTNTTINVYELVTDPPTAVRVEIYGPNYNNAGLLSEDAKAFKASFQEIKKYFKTKKVNLNNLQIIYGNRQYIQDTATLWIKEFGLLN